MIITNQLLQQLINEEFEKALAARRLAEATIDDDDRLRNKKPKRRG